ncbi:MAG: 50S ribosomal protein L11 methyltransferase [Cyanobacteria bacterium P01_A01_bin.45]
MGWIELSINTTDEGVDWVYTLLPQVNYTGDIQVNPIQTPSVNFKSDSSPWKFNIFLYLVNDANINARITQIDQLFSSLRRTNMVSELELSKVDQIPNKVETSENQVHHVGEIFTIISSQTADQFPKNKNKITDKIIIKLKPSLAFGSGLHPATVLCLQLLKEYVKPQMKVLDLGSGSGILSIAAAKLGGNVVAIDNDPIAVKSTQETVNLNQLEPQIQVLEASLGHGATLGHWMGGQARNHVSHIPAEKNFDLIVANIFARIHISLAAEYFQALRQNNTSGGILITSGFTRDYEESVTAALTKQKFTKINSKQLNEWIAIAYTAK